MTAMSSDSECPIYPPIPPTCLYVYQKDKGLEVEMSRLIARRSPTSPPGAGTQGAWQSRQPPLRGGKTGHITNQEYFCGSLVPPNKVYIPERALKALRFPALGWPSFRFFPHYPTQQATFQLY